MPTKKPTVFAYKPAGVSCHRSHRWVFKSDSFSRETPGGDVAAGQLAGEPFSFVNGFPLAAFPSPPPPEHQFQTPSVRIRARHPFFQQLEMRREPTPKFFARRAEGRAVLVRNQIIDSEILALGFEPSQNCPNIIITLFGLDRAEQSVLENPIK